MDQGDLPASCQARRQDACGIAHARHLCNMAALKECSPLQAGVKCRKRSGARRLRSLSSLRCFPGSRVRTPPLPPCPLPAALLCVPPAALPCAPPASRQGLTFGFWLCVHAEVHHHLTRAWLLAWPNHECVSPAARKHGCLQAWQCCSATYLLRALGCPRCRLRCCLCPAARCCLRPAARCCLQTSRSSECLALTVWSCFCKLPDRQLAPMHCSTAQAGRHTRPACTVPTWAGGQRLQVWQVLGSDELVVGLDLAQELLCQAMRRQPVSYCLWLRCLQTRQALKWRKVCLDWQLSERQPRCSMVSQMTAAESAASFARDVAIHMGYKQVRVYWSVTATGWACLVSWHHQQRLELPPRVLAGEMAREEICAGQPRGPVARVAED